MAINPVVGHLWGSYSTADGFISLGNDLAGAINDKDWAGIIKATASIINTASSVNDLFGNPLADTRSPDPDSFANKYCSGIIKLDR